MIIDSNTLEVIKGLIFKPEVLSIGPNLFRYLATQIDEEDARVIGRIKQVLGIPYRYLLNLFTDEMGRVITQRRSDGFFVIEGIINVEVASGSIQHIGFFYNISKSVLYLDGVLMQTPNDVVKLLRQAEEPVLSEEKGLLSLMEQRAQFLVMRARSDDYSFIVSRNLLKPKAYHCYLQYGQDLMYRSVRFSPLCGSLGQKSRHGLVFKLLVDDLDRGEFLLFLPNAEGLALGLVPSFDGKSVKGEMFDEVMNRDRIASMRR